MTTAVKHIHSATESTTNIPVDWEPVKDSYTANQVIDAYLNGKKDGNKEAYIDDARQEFSLNVKLATSIGEELLKIGNDKNLKIKGIHLKADNIRSFELLFLVDNKVYADDNFREAYVLSRQIKEKYKSPKVFFSFSFISECDGLDEDNLAADGYFMRYEKGETA